MSGVTSLRREDLVLLGELATTCEITGRRVVSMTRWPDGPCQADARTRLRGRDEAIDRAHSSSHCQPWPGVDTSARSLVRRML